MEKLKFKLISNGEVIINDSPNYYIKDNIINFKIKDDFYKYDKENIVLTKKDNEKELVINFSNLVILITMIKEGLTVNYPMTESKREITENKVKLEYTLDSGEKLINTILIEF